MSFYDIIAKDIPWEITPNTDGYLKVKAGKLQLPSPGWLVYHLRFLDSVIESINAFKAGQLSIESYDIDKIEKRVVSDWEEGIAILSELSQYELFSIDIESNNLLPDRVKNKLLCIGVAYAPNKGVSFLKSCFNNEKFCAKFEEFTREKQHKFIFHNGIFDISRTRIIADLTLKIDEDTLLKHYCGINEHKGTHGLKDLAQLYLGFPDWEKPLDTWKRSFCRANKIKLKDFQYEYFDQETLAKYNVIDCCATFQLNSVFDKLMRENSKYIYRKLIEAVPHYANMITRGMKLDMTYWEQLKNQLEAERVELDAQLKQLLPGVLISSPLQLRAALIKYFPRENIESTDAKTMKFLSTKYPNEPLLELINNYRKNSKYLKTYVAGLWNRKDCDDIIHCEFKLHGTETGRLSSSNPNMQNIPRSPLIKSLFVARPGYTFIQLDYSQLELRVLAHVSGDRTLIQCYKDGRDLHSEMQGKIFKDRFDAHDKDQRMAAKIVNFGIPYGRTPSGVAQQLGVDMTTAKRYLSDWHAGAPMVSTYIEKCHEAALKDPQDVYYTVFGRARHYFITDANLNHVKNQSVNFPITSTANDITIHALVDIGNWLQESGADAYLVNTVHDSIILEVRPEDAQWIAEKGQKIMSEIPPKFLKDTEVPFRADAEVGQCWGQLSEPDWPESEDEEEEEDNESSSD